MTMTLPRSTWGLQSLASRRCLSAVLLALSLLVSCVPGTPIKREARRSDLHLKNQAERFQTVEKPAAHFQADPSKTNTLEWTTSADNTFSQGNLTLQNNKMLIQRSGLYFIYTQATFGDRRCPPEGEGFLSHGVILWSTERQQRMQLLDAQKSACGEQPTAASAHPSWSKSIFQGGAFRLKKGDKLETVTQGEEYLKRVDGAIYFGAYAL